MQRILCNLDFGPAVEFTPFSVRGYHFEPIPEKQPRRPRVYDHKHRALYHRRIVPNARVHCSGREPSSVIFKDRLRAGNSKRTFLDDLLALTSILIGRNVRRWSEHLAPDFPAIASNQIKATAAEPGALSRALECASNVILETEWQKKYDDGFHILELISFSNILTLELRFLAYAAIWEYVFWSERKNELQPETLQDIRLKDKVFWLIQGYHLTKRRKSRRGPDHCHEVFAELRNQIAHGGKFRTGGLSGALRDASPFLCYKYMRLFERVTENLVLSSVGIRRDEESWALEELLSQGRVEAYEREAAAGW